MNENPPEPKTKEESEVIEGEYEVVDESGLSYLELKRDYKEKQRAYRTALESDMDSRSALKKMFGLGRKNLSPETQALYDESLAAEKDYYQSFAENQKDKIEARLNRKNESDEQISILPSLVKRHITNPERERLEAQERELPPRMQAILNTIKGNKYAMVAAAGGGLALKSLSLLSSFGVGLAAGAGARWVAKKEIARQERNLEKKADTFTDFFESGSIDDLGDIKNEYFQDLRKVDDRRLKANLAAAGIAVGAGMGAHDALEGAIPADVDTALGDKLGEYWDTAKEKVGSLFDHEQHQEGWYQDVLNDIEAPDSASAETAESTTSWYEDVEQSVNETAETTPEAEAPVAQPEGVTEQSAESAGSEEEYRKEVIEQKKTEIDVSHAETQAETAELSPEAQEKLDNMRAVQEAQESAHEMINADAEAGEGSFESLIQEATESKYEVQPGDNIWDIIETKLQSTEAYNELEPAQQIHMIDELKDKVMAMSPGEMTEFGIGSGDPHLIEVGEELDFSKLFSEESLGTAVEHAEGLSEAEIASIEANNPQIVEASAAGAEAGEAAVGPSEAPESEIATESPESGETVAEEATPNAEVPDYSSSEAVPGEVETETVDGEEVGTSEPEAEATMEVVSNSPREVTTEEIMPEREKVESLFASPLVKDFQGTITPDWLMDRDAVAGFEPLYTNELLATETPVISASRLDQFITTEIFNAYAQGHINLPAQHVYMLDSVSGMDILEGINEASPQVQETLLSQFKADAALDLSSEEVRELGVASGDLNDLTPGDQVKTGEIMKLILQNMAERINGTNT